MIDAWLVPIMYCNPMRADLTVNRTPTGIPAMERNIFLVAEANGDIAGFAEFVRTLASAVSSALAAAALAY